MSLMSNRWPVLTAILVLFLLSLSQDGPRPAPMTIVSEQVPVDCSLPVSRSWIEKVNRIRWVAYSSPNPDLNLMFYQPNSRNPLSGPEGITKSAIHRLDHLWFRRHYGNTVSEHCSIPRVSGNHYGHLGTQ